ncbi:hypothetical protein [Aneurinibacillus migulanus]|uniref:Uncharacterized protein n=1 Tax=Aneurinibacillus migulanus TaxID=47500 RepID=A0A0D1UZ86_ANEMI|nr:hypothetical protein [Aneurinibacillus migulanus]KIV52409.1 hypothetical protein TS65_23630 [Aneurinibacillus migulanus]KON94584.1 hypothetical protein AF333_02810 [Aneurinibacillus migulanus]MED0892622.1 hypothetical protein [Aneurinibacillus migulanus]MED1614964.1 hypothetical protein [Aneurinibacillus migulanus]GED17799.1 hypothetical protein AMI01nite_57900 [Aneurinibacillus migulanus]
MDKKRYVAIKQESDISFLPIVLFEKLARRVPNVAVSLWSVWHDGRKRPSGNARVFFLLVEKCGCNLWEFGKRTQNLR